MEENNLDKAIQHIIESLANLQLMGTIPYAVVENGELMELGYKWINPEAQKEYELGVKLLADLQTMKLKQEQIKHGKR